MVKAIFVQSSSTIPTGGTGKVMWEDSTAPAGQGLKFNNDIIPTGNTTLGNLETVETGATGQLISVAKGTAYNQAFGSTTGDVVEIGTDLGASEIVETDGSNRLITATKGTAYNKAFGTGVSDIPEIGTILGNTKTMTTDASGKLTATKNVPTGDYIGTTDTQTLTNKTIDDVTNTVTTDKLRTATTQVDISASSAPIAGQILRATSSTIASWQSPNIEIASNQGVGGIGLFDAKVGDDLQFRNINVASNKLSVVLDAGNKEVDLDVDVGNIEINDLNGTLQIDKGGTGQTSFLNSAFIRTVAGGGGNYPNIDATYNPLVRFEPLGIAGTAGSLTWTPSIGVGGSLIDQGVSTDYVDASVGGKRAIFLNPSASNDYSQVFRLILPSSISSLNDFTFAFVVQDLESIVNFGRFISLLEENTAISDFANASACALFLSNGTGGALTTFYSGSQRVWIPSDYSLSNLTANTPYVFIYRYTHTGNEFRIWINSAVDTIVNTQTLNMGGMTNIRNIDFGRANTQPSNASRLRVAEVMVFDNALSDATITNLSNDLLVEYGIRGGSAGMASLKSVFDSTVVPVSTNDSSQGYDIGSRWIDTVEGKEYICIDDTATSAVWKETTNKEKSYGEAYWVGNVTTTPNPGPLVLGTWYKMQGTSVVGLKTSDITITDNRIQYTGADTLPFNCTARFCIATQSNNRSCEFALYKNGSVLVPCSAVKQRCGDSGTSDFESVSIACFVNLSTNDYIELWGRNNENSETLICDSLNIAINDLK